MTSPEKAAWSRLMLNGTISPDEHFSPSKAKEKHYSSLLRQTQAASPLQDLPPKNPSGTSGEWSAAKPCPICDRIKDDDCRISDDGKAVLCHHGSTHRPPAGLKLGQVTKAQWAYCGEKESAAGTASLFKIDTPRPAAIGFGRDPSPEKSKERSWSQLVAAMLDSIKAGDDDAAMATRAEAITRFRRTDSQIEAALFKLHTQQEIGITNAKGPDSLDLGRITGMKWQLEGFTPANDLILVWGEGGAGKTTAALGMGFAVINGEGFLDHTKPATPGKVLFIASDSGPQPLLSAIQELGHGSHAALAQGPSQAFYVWAADQDQGMTAWAADLRGCIRLLDFIKSHQISLVIIDSCKAVCSGASLDYTNNQLVTALLTYFKEVICPHTSVIWLNHDGVANGATAGAKAWKEVPSIVHAITNAVVKDSDGKKGRVDNGSRHWTVQKNRMGPKREFDFQLKDGELVVAPDVEKVGNCAEAVVQVISEQLALGINSVAKVDLQSELKRLHGYSHKTLDNTLTTMTRSHRPAIRRCLSRRGHYELINPLKGCEIKSLGISSNRSHTNGSSDFPTSSQWEKQVPNEKPLGSHREPPNPSHTNGSGLIPNVVGIHTFGSSWDLDSD
jgi:archaellum biogenesis ATPase FlaH